MTVLGGFGGFERGWAEIGPQLEWAALQFAGDTYSQHCLSTIVGTDVASLVRLEIDPTATLTIAPRPSWNSG